MAFALVVTTIQAPTPALKQLAEACTAAGAPFIIAGDRKSPADFALPSTDYYSIERQHEAFGTLATALPENHYTRKNIAYLAALQSGVDWVVETDDDNFPREGFLREPASRIQARRPAGEPGWVNVYDFFAPDAPVWPRGFPLQDIQPGREPVVATVEAEASPLIVQSLADANPDVDAVFRLTRKLPIHFSQDAAPLTLAQGHWSPFNSQATWFHRRVSPLLYLPSFCSFRMTDIWRSFVAQRCLWAMDSELLFIAPKVYQERNEHNLLRDFADEVPGYLNNHRIAEALEACSLSGDPAADLLRCYSALVEADFFPAAELALVEQWVQSLSALS